MHFSLNIILLDNNEQDSLVNFHLVYLFKSEVTYTEKHKLTDKRQSQNRSHLTCCDANHLLPSVWTWVSTETPTSSYQQQFVWAIQLDAPRTFQHGSLHWEGFGLHSCKVLANKKIQWGKVRRKGTRGNIRQRAHCKRSQTQVQQTACSQSTATIHLRLFHLHVTVCNKTYPTEAVEGQQEEFKAITVI